MRQVLQYTDETGVWIAECPSLPGCISQGETRELALANIRKAISEYTAALIYEDDPVPEERFEAMIVAV